MTRDSRTAYRRWLWLAPPALRRRHGAAMAEAFADALDHARGSGRLAVAWIWMRALVDLLAARARVVVPFRPASADHSPRGLMMGTDIRGSLRAFRRQRVSTLLVVAMLALGIAASLVVFSLINALFLRPLPFDEPGRLVYINEKAPRWDLERTGIHYPDFHQWQQAAQTFEAIALFDDVTVNVSDGEGAERITGAQVTHQFMRVLGVQPVIGRTFTADDDRPGGPRVTIISERFWHQRMAADPAVLGRTLQLNGVAFEIIGVMPRRAEFPFDMWFWIPLAGDPNQQGTSYSHEGVGRLKPGVTVEQADQDLQRAQIPIWERRDQERNVSPFAQPLHDTLVRDYRRIAQALFAAVTLLLIVACANVAAVMLTRAIARRREMGIRLAIGASRSRLLRQLLIESLLLSIAGGMTGVLLGRWALHALVAALPDAVPVWISLGIDARIVTYSLLLTLGAAIIFGWAPALHATRGDLRSTMADSAAGSTTSPGGRRTMMWLVGAEFALAAMLLASGALLFRAFGEVRRIDPGYDPRGVLMFSVSLPPAIYRDAPARLAFWDRLLERVRALPGVTAAGVISCPPLTCHWGNFYRIEGRRPLQPGEANPVVLSRIASEGYFEAMGVRLREGRFFDARDGRPDTEPVAIVNEHFVRTFWPDAEPGRSVLGRRLAFNGEQNPWMTVIGVTTDVKHYGLERPTRPGLYFPAHTLGLRTSGMTVVVRTLADPESLVPTATAIVRELDPALPVYQVRTAEGMLAGSMRTRATYSWMLGVFAGLALVLALGGTYGVTSYLVTQRTREIGIRLAMGARTVQIVRAVFGSSLRAVIIGMAIGLIGVVASARWMSELLFDVSPRDPWMLAAAAAVLVLSAIAANWVPARRAARTDPVQSLRV